MPGNFDHRGSIEYAIRHDKRLAHCEGCSHVESMTALVVPCRDITVGLANEGEQIIDVEIAGLCEPDIFRRLVAIAPNGQAWPGVCSGQTSQAPCACGPQGEDVEQARRAPVGSLVASERRLVRRAQQRAELEHFTKHGAGTVIPGENASRDLIDSIILATHRAIRDGAIQGDAAGCRVVVFVHDIGIAQPYCIHRQQPRGVVIHLVVPVSRPERDHGLIGGADDNRKSRRRCSCWTAGYRYAGEWLTDDEPCRCSHVLARGGRPHGKNSR